MLPQRVELTFKINPLKFNVSTYAYILKVRYRLSSGYNPFHRLVEIFIIYKRNNILNDYT